VQAGPTTSAGGSAHFGARPLLGRRPAVWALAGYLSLSILLWGRFVLGDFDSESLAGNDGVPSAFMWLFEWWPHALLHTTNPFYTHVILVPDGVNLSWVTSVPGLSLAFAPITLIFGPVVSWNVLALLAPALSAWTAFLLCHHLTRATPPSLLGGYLFGFSPYVVRHLEGLPQLSLVALVPLIALLVVRRVEGTIGERSFVAALAIALAAQFSISTEVLLSTTMIGGLVLLAAIVMLHELRPQLRRTGVLAAAAYAGMAVLVSPFIFYALFRGHTAPDYTYVGVGADLLAWVVPNARGQAIAFGTHRWAQGFGYVGVPLLVVLLLFARESWRDRRRRLVLVALAVTSVASLGGSLVVGSSDTGIPLPWAIVENLPLVEYALPVRMSVFAFLAAAIAVTLWLAARGGPGRWALAGAAVLALAPNVVGSTDWTTPAEDPAFFSSGEYRRYLSSNDRVFPIPATGASMRWQANANFDFDLAAGGFASYPASYTRWPIWLALVLGAQPTADEADGLYQFLHDRGVTAIVVDQRRPGHWRSLFGTLGVRPRVLGGVLLYQLGPAGLPIVPKQVVGAPAGAFELGSGALRSSRGRTYRFATGVHQGYVEGSAIRGDRVNFSGWAGEVDEGHPAHHVVLFSGTRFVAIARTGGHRADLGEIEPTLSHTGFQVSIPLKLLQDRGGRPKLRAYGLDDVGHAFRLRPYCGAAQQYARC
jgi:hypothetical protein